MRDTRGFSLIELMIIVVIGVAVSVIAFWGWGTTKSYRLGSASKELYSDLQKIRQDAMTKSGSGNSRGFGIRFDSNTSYTLFEFNDADTDFTYDGTGEETVVRQHAFSSEVSVTINNSGNPTGNVIIYDKQGLKRTTDWSTVGDRTYVIRLTGTDNIRCVQAKVIRIREGVWDGSNCSES